ncbi:MAG: hypothetical protein FMNOHCHN_00091 [Ignavibacteriaceae bacterium]|nr:hypothetical protein [Ignavibacteriaceae bacterium]
MFGSYEKIFSGSKYTTGTANGKDEKGGGIQEPRAGTHDYSITIHQEHFTTIPGLSR